MFIKMADFSINKYAITACKSSFKYVKCMTWTKKYLICSPMLYRYDFVKLLISFNKYNL